MAVSLASSSRGAARGRRRAGRMAEINVTPMVDVMLVLLIIFMVAAPLLSVGVPVDLPKTQAKQITEADDKPLTLSVQADGKLYLQETEVQLAQIGPKLKAISNNNPDARIYVRGDKRVDYGRVMEVMGAVTQAGYSKVSLIANLPDRGSGPKGATP